MENKLQLQIIQETESAPFTLNNLREIFLAIEAQFNSTVSNLSNEKSAIESNSSNALTFIQNQHKQQIEDVRHNWENGTYVGKVVSSIVSKWSSARDNCNIFRWIAVVVGVLIFFGVKWYLGIFVGGVGYWIFNSLAEGLTNNISSANSIAPNGRTSFGSSKNLVGNRE
jgi:hypothetical protein